MFICYRTLTFVHTDIFFLHIYIYIIIFRYIYACISSNFVATVVARYFVATVVARCFVTSCSFNWSFLVGNFFQFNVTGGNVYSENKIC